MRELDAVLFDLDDTLRDDTTAFTGAAEEVAREIAAERGIDALLLKDAYVNAAHGFWKALSPLQLRTRMADLRIELWGAALAEAGLSDRALAVRSAQRYNAARLGRYALFPGAMDLLRRLKAHRVRLGIITNGFSETHREKIAVLQIADLFDAVFMPDEVGMVKPDPLLFSHACARLCSAPARSAMVGDRYDRDIAGALSAGLYTVWVNVRDEELPPGAMPPDATVRTIDAAGAYLLNA